jgi:hypothetical protein
MGCQFQAASADEKAAIHLLPEFCIVVSPADNLAGPFAAEKLPTPQQNPISRALWYLVCGSFWGLRAPGKNIEDSQDVSHRWRSLFS